MFGNWIGLSCFDVEAGFAVKLLFGQGAEPVLGDLWDARPVG